MRVVLVAMILVINLLSPSSTHTFLDDEAGLGAWFFAGQEIILESNLLRNQMRLIEDDQPNYLIGYIASTPDDVKVFISRSGWVVAYHLKSMVDSLISTDCTNTLRLDLALNKIAAAIPIPTPTIHYHHWLYSTAENLLQLGAMGRVNNYEFWFTLPGSYTYYDYSYLSSMSGWATSDLILDDLTIATTYTNSIKAGDLAPSNIVPIAAHKVNITNSGPVVGTSCGIITVIYTEAPNGRFTYSGVGFARTTILEPVDPGLLAAAAPVPHLYPIYLPGVWQ